MPQYKVYLTNNYLFLEDNDTGNTYEGIAKEVFIIKREKNDGNCYTFKGVEEQERFKSIPFTDLLDSSGDAWSDEDAWITWYTSNSGKISTGGGGGGGFDSIQAMYDDNPNKVQLTDGTNTMSLDPFNVFVTTNLGTGDSSVVGSVDVSGLGAYTQIQNDGSNFLAKVIAYDSGNGIGAQLVSNGKIIITRVDGEVEIKSDNISTNQDHQLPDGTGTYGLSVKVDGVSYPFNADGETDDIASGGGGGFSSLQQMFDADPVNTTITDGTNTISLDPKNVNIVGTVADGESASIGIIDTTGAQALSGVNRNGSSVVGQYEATDN